MFISFRKVHYFGIIIALQGQRSWCFKFQLVGVRHHYDDDLAFSRGGEGGDQLNSSNGHAAAHTSRRSSLVCYVTQKSVFWAKRVKFAPEILRLWLLIKFIRRNANSSDMSTSFCSTENVFDFDFKSFFAEPESTIGYQFWLACSASTKAGSRVLSNCQISSVWTGRKPNQVEKS